MLGIISTIVGGALRPDPQRPFCVSPGIEQ